MGNLCHGGAPLGQTLPRAPHFWEHDEDDVVSTGCSTANEMACPLSRRLLCFGDHDPIEMRRARGSRGSDTSFMDQTQRTSFMDQTQCTSFMDQTQGTSFIEQDQTQNTSFLDRTQHASVSYMSSGPWGSEGGSFLNLEDDEDALPGESVYLHLYDLNDTIAHMNSVGVDLLGFGGALHVAVEALAHEWSFGLQGVSLSTPKQNQHYTYRQTLYMGKTRLQRREIISAILAMQSEWSGAAYDVFENNCGTFCNALCLQLGVGAMPAWVTRFPETVGRLPAIRSLADVITRAAVTSDSCRQEQHLEQHRQLCTIVAAMTAMDPDHPELMHADAGLPAPLPSSSEEFLRRLQQQPGQVVPQFWPEDLFFPEELSPMGHRPRPLVHGGLQASLGSPLMSNSPVHCRFSSSPCCHIRPLPQQRCEAFHVDQPQQQQQQRQQLHLQQHRLAQRFQSTSSDGSCDLAGQTAAPTGPSSALPDLRAQQHTLHANGIVEKQPRTIFMMAAGLMLEALGEGEKNDV
eukprot:CAMPEP_0177176970 /NCGR_PEP_ID=MMETSP0367-20130122/13544_1 /TAXON_ID=447022 ORGANISM="Scrippsiella hangoei-like, Strain SHHI-4" /NCGR_SAMPLE_ID=MMETSP0367 /ASSEMBLY_ACC=CAM_ASM_000362 /LENGTH=516 /DNA_ID=CAMNT_0018623527 /DNA_START=13 /DNA_END=1564 /DNA_ORIENTATION=-